MKIDLPPDRPQLSVTLDDGSVALLSPLRPEDGSLLVEGLEELSIEGRYNRFGYGRSGLTAGELSYLSNVDQRNHVAWGVALGEEGAGVGRYIRIEGTDCAEVAVTVLDRFQRRGLGRLLFGALAAVARADGISELCFEVGVDNVAVKKLISGLDATLDESDGSLSGRVVVDDLEEGPHDDELVAVMLEARGA